MADYNFRYRLNLAPSGFIDGSGMVGHPITALAYDNGTGVVVPGHSKTFCVPASELQVVMDMPDSTGPERQAKNAAYKDALSANLNTQNIPITGWSVAQMEALMDNNDAAAAVAAEADEYITVTLGQSYPVEFNL